MNRNFPPPPQQFRRPRPDVSAYTPARVLMALIGQSEKRYMFLREAIMKLDAGFGQLEMESQNLFIAFAEYEPDAVGPLRESLGAVHARENVVKMDLERLMHDEMVLQGELKRFLKGQPPTIAPSQMRPPPQLGQGGPPQGYGPGYTREGYVPPGYSQGPQQGYPQQQQQMMPQQGPQQGPQQPSQPQIPPEMMAAPQGPIDYRDPKQAAAALLRAQPMPLGPGSTQPAMQQGGGVFVPPGAYGVTPAQVPYGVPPGAYVPPPSQVPVMQGAPETATQVMQQSQPQPAAPAVNVPAPQSNGAAGGGAKNATS